MKHHGKTITTLLSLCALLTAGLLGLTFYFSSSSIHSLLTENHELNKAIKNLTEERQIGYASVVSQTVNDKGVLESLVKLVQTAPGRPETVVAEDFFVVEGDTIHFDALIVKFSNDYIKEGKARSLYLWRRIYGENTAPSEGQDIHFPGEEPERYKILSETLRIQDRAIFWSAIWNLANDPKALEEYGITAIYGNAVYTQMEPGRIYQFKISPSGQIYPDLLIYE